MAKHNSIVKKSMLPLGSVIRGTYRIDSYLSSGGFGNTYVATHVNFNERYALKEFFMKGVSHRDSNSITVSVSNEDKELEFNEQLKKFKKEAQRLRRLRNDHIVRVHDLFEENGTAYYVMDYIEGENLKDRIARTKSPMSEAEVNGVLRQILDALSEVHAQGIWHMDLKPANVMLDTDGVVKLIDFGASKQFNIKTGGALSTSAVTFTNGYAPIEQMERSYEKFGPWTDFYALGATIYNLLTGSRPPMPSDINDDITADKRIALPMPGTVSTRMRDLVLWLMRTNRVERPSSVEQILNYLDNPSAHVPFSTTDASATVISRPVEPARPMVPKGVSSSQTVIASPSSPSTAGKKPNKNLIYGAIAAAAVLLVGLFILLGRGGNDTADMAKKVFEVVEERVDEALDNYLPVTIPLGECVYSGEVNKGGMPHGYGTAKFLNGDRCDGTFVNGNLDGDNVIYSFNDGNWFEGTVRDNRFYEGSYYKQDGSYFKGTFKDNNPDQGTWYDKNGNKKSSSATGAPASPAPVQETTKSNKEVPKKEQGNEPSQPSQQRNEPSQSSQPDKAQGNEPSQPDKEQMKQKKLKLKLSVKQEADPNNRCYATVTVSNPNDQAVTTTVTLSGTSGFNYVTQTVTIPAKGSKTVSSYFTVKKVVKNASVKATESATGQKAEKKNLQLCP